MTNIFKNKKAFSLVELSIVLIIIALLVVGVIGGQRLIALGKLSTAKTTTKSSPVSSIKGLALWLEPTLPESILEDDTEDGTPIAQWKDINTQVGNPQAVIINGAPEYKSELALETINRIPAIRFDGAADYLTIDNFTLNTEMTIFFVGKFPNSDFAMTLVDANGLGVQVSGGEDAGQFALYLKGLNSSNEASDIAVGAADWFGDIEAVGTVRYNGSEALYRRNDEDLTESNVSSTFSEGTIINNAVTGTLHIGAARPQVTGAVSNFSAGSLGEVIIFDRALPDTEMNLVIEYLMSKWAIKDQN